MDKNPFNILSATKDSIPRSTAKIGVIDSLGNSISGTGTNFQDELNIGDFILSLAQEEVRRVVNIDPNTQYAQIDRAFTVPLAALALITVGVDEAAMRELSILNQGAADGEVDGHVFTVNQADTWNANDAQARGQHGFIEPKVVDATATVIGYSILR